MEITPEKFSGLDYFKNVSDEQSQNKHQSPLS